LIWRIGPGAIPAGTPGCWTAICVPPAPARHAP